MRTVPTHAEVGKQLRCEVVMRGSMSISQPDGHIRVRQAGIGKAQVCLAGQANTLVLPDFTRLITHNEMLDFGSCTHTAVAPCHRTI